MVVNNEIKDTENVKVTSTDSSAVTDTNEVKDTVDTSNVKDVVTDAISNDIKATLATNVENEASTESPVSTKIEVDHGNIENMMNSIFDNVIQVRPTPMVSNFFF